MTTRSDDNKILNLMFKRIEEKLDDIKTEISEIKEQNKKTDRRILELEQGCVTMKQKVDLHDKVVIGGVTLILVGVVVGILKIVIL